MKPAEMTDYWKNKNLYTSYFQFNVCRLCANECDSLTPIFGNCDDNDRLDLKIKKCLPVIMVQEDDIKPKQICAPCISKLNLCSQLIESCIAADYKFQVLIQKAYNPAPIFLAQTQNLNYLSQPTWTTDTCVKPSEKPDVLLIENLNSFNKTSEQELVVMVELKYKDPVAQDCDTYGAENKIDPVNNEETIVLNVADVKSPSRIDDCCSIDMQSDLNPKIDLVDKNDYEPTYCNLVNSNYIGACSELINDMFQSVEKAPPLLAHLPETQVSNAPLTDESVKTPELDGKRYKCTTCDKSFARRSRCKAHIISHSKLRPFNCENCGKNFITKWECKLHQRIHIGVHTCEFCGKAFSVRNKLERHRRVHTGEKPFACKYCDKSFADKRNLDNHLRTHTGERPYVCQTCSDSFRTLTHLKDHQTVHTKEAQYSCYFCDKRFKWKTNLHLHLKKHSSKDANPTQQNMLANAEVASGATVPNSTF